MVNCLELSAAEKEHKIKMHAGRHVQGKAPRHCARCIECTHYCALKNGLRCTHPI